MSTIHGSVADVLVGTFDISTYCNSITINMQADSHDVTTYGATAHEFVGGLKNATAQIQGFYDSSTASGTPKSLLVNKEGTALSFAVRPEGTGSGLPTRTFSGLITAYNESMPVADMVTFTLDLQVSGAITHTSQ